MTELLMTFVGGALGSSHCLGMCGGFALALGAGSNGWRVNLFRQLVYSVGRVFTYSAAGAVAGYGGLRLANGLPSTIPIQAILALVAGALLLYEGLRATGLLRWHRHVATAGCLAPRFFGPLLAGGSWANVFLAGVFTGFLPCGLVYAFLALASTTQNMFDGAIRMALFGLGTVPLMVIAGVGGAALGVASRRHVFRLAGWCVALSGAVSIVRGFSFLGLLSGSDHVGCPFCH